MNKTYNVNIGGVAFIIDENAYEKLTGYLNALKVHFREDGGDEIVGDIETRIGELFKESLEKDKATVISVKMVDQAIQVMGTPEDFGMEEEDNSYTRTKGTSQNPNKRFFRDAEEKKVGGVAAGLAAYFDVDPVWIWLAFVLITLMGGSGVLIYIILWLSIPEAVTTSEKLQMKGEKVDISNIEKKIKEGAGNLGEAVSRSSKAVSESMKDVSPKVSNLASDISGGLGDIIKVGFGAIFKLVGFGLIVGGTVALVVITALIFNLPFVFDNDFLSYNWSPGNLLYLLSSTFENNSIEALFLFGISTLIIVPVVGILVTGIKLLFSIRGGTKIWGIALTSIFFLGILSLIFSGITLSRYMSSFTQNDKEIQLVAYDIIDIKLKSDPFKGGIDRPSFNLTGILFEENSTIFSNAHLIIRESDLDSNYLTVSSESRGSSFKEANYFSERINYNLDVQDSTISIAPYYSYPSIDPCRFQGIDIYLYLKLGQKIKLDKNISRILRNNYYGNYKGEIYQMTANGLEECKNGKCKITSSTIITEETNTEVN